MSQTDHDTQDSEYESVNESGSDYEQEQATDRPPTPPPLRGEMLHPSAQGRYMRPLNPVLSENVTTLTTDNGCKLYLVGTAHFSKESQEEVIQTIQTINPDHVVLELCKGRVNILSLDESTLLKEAKNIDFNKFRSAIKQSGMVQGVMHLLLLSMSAHLTEQLGMVPGGEFRVAYQEAMKIPGCRVHLGDRPIDITLSRALGSLTVWQKIRLAWNILTSKDPISKEDVERCKNKFQLEEMLLEMTGEFPALSEVFVKERDLYLAKVLRSLTKPVPSPMDGEVPSAVVGVVGIGHTPGIIKYWDQAQTIDISTLITKPDNRPTALGITIRWTIRAAFVGAIAWAGVKTAKWTMSLVS